MCCIYKYLQYFGVLYTGIFIALQLQIKKTFFIRCMSQTSLIYSSNNQVPFTKNVELHKKNPQDQYLVSSWLTPESLNNQNLVVLKNQTQPLYTQKLIYL